MSTTVGLSIGSILLILAVLMLLRARSSRFEIKPSDIVVAVLPVMVFLLVTGKLQKFEIGESGIKIETAFIQASASAIESQVRELRYQTIQIGPKQDPGKINQLLEDRTEGLLFHLGHGGYVGDAIMEYLTRLTRQPFLKYLIVNFPDGRFFAMIDAPELAMLLQSGKSSYTARDLADWLNTGRRDSLRGLPGFISHDHAVMERTDKSQALRRMETLDVESLPVIGSDGSFSGVVSRSRLTASLLVDVAENLGK